MDQLCCETELLESARRKLYLPRKERPPKRLVSLSEWLVRHYNNLIGRLVASEEATKTPCWVVTEGEARLLHVQDDPM